MEEFIGASVNSVDQIGREAVGSIHSGLRWYGRGGVDDPTDGLSLWLSFPSTLLPTNWTACKGNRRDATMIIKII